MAIDSIFFRMLTRRAEYETNPDGGGFYGYAHYRNAIAEDCEFRCVYCDCHEDAIGGRETMELDHFRPWNKMFGLSKEKKFQHLRDDPSNLVHACGVCNSFKWAHWPTEDPDRPYDDEKGWIEPFGEHRADFLEVMDDGKVTGRKPPGQYQIRKLRLNRPFLQRQRELLLLMEAWTTIEKKWQAIVDEQPGTPHAQTATEALVLLHTIRQLVGLS